MRLQLFKTISKGGRKDENEQNQKRICDVRGDLSYVAFPLYGSLLMGCCYSCLY
jgi:hypothetical protein